MKDIKTFILEGKKRTFKGTVGDFATWACLCEDPKQKKDKETISPEDVQGIMDNGWFDNFDDDCKAAAKFLNDNWDKEITIVSQETPNDWEVSFELDGKEYVAVFMSYFGDMSVFNEY